MKKRLQMWGIHRKVKHLIAWLKQLLLQPRFPEIKTTELISLGSKYGGKIFSPLGLQGTTILSAGCGEDITFDVEIARMFDLKVILIDPTPRSITHVTQVLDRIGAPSTLEVSQSDGKQDVSAYNLQGLKLEQFTLIEKALFGFVGRISLFPPSDATHISHSFLDLHKTRTLIEYQELKVDCTNVKSILDELNITNFSLLKLDIEGAQLEVLEAMFSDNIFPDQILVEIDELHFPSLTSYRRARKCVGLLASNSYELIARENKYDLSFIRKDLIN